MKQDTTLLISGRIWEINRPQVMGILNSTPDSFYEGSRIGDVSEIERRAAAMVRDGVDIFDIGGYSTRPGADEVSPEEEYERVALAVDVVRKNWPYIPVSVDTFRASVAKKAIEQFGVEIINDVSGGTLDPAIWEVVADKKVVYVLTHMRGTPADMHLHVDYDDVTADVIGELMGKVAQLRQLGVADVILDPGFGFAKTVEQNYRLLDELDQLCRTGLPVLVGISRKSMLCKPLGISPDEALCPTVAADMAALMKGALFLRVHDVLPAAQSVNIFSLMKNS